MSIEIIERGDHPDNREYEATCRKCKSKLKWLKKDAKRVHIGDQRDGPFTQIDCPICGSYVTGY